MAEKLRSGGATSFDAAMLKKVVKNINAAKAKATEMNGEAGALTKNACEEHNLDKTALTLVSRLARKELSDAQAIVGAIVTYAHAMGFFDTSDLFQDHVKAMRVIVEAVDKGVAGSGSATVRKLSTASTDPAPATH